MCNWSHSFCVCLYSMYFLLKISKTFMFKLQKRGQRKGFFLCISESDGVFSIKFTSHDEVMFSIVLVFERETNRQGDGCNLGL